MCQICNVDFYEMICNSCFESICIYPEHVLTWEGYGNWRVSYPEHVLTWEGYGNRRVSSCVRVCVCGQLIAS